MLMLLSVAIWAQSSTIRLQSYPQMTVADGRSTVTISAEIRDKSGRLVPDGTQVVFTTNIGFFNDPVVKTSSGIARAIFSAGSVPGSARIQASALAYNAVATLEVDIVSDRSMLSTAKEYIEVTAPDSLIYSMDQRVIAATGTDKGVAIRYRDVEIWADDVQVSVPTYEVRARKARLKFGKVEQDFEELYFRLNQRRGYGTTTFEVPNYTIGSQGRFIVFNKTMRKVYGMAALTLNGVESPKDSVSHTLFEFTDILDSTSTVYAKKAVAFPKGHIQFHRAELMVGETKVMTLPLFQVNMYGATPIVTEQIVNVYDSQFSVNYPYYLSLKPGETSLVRLRTGERYGRSVGGSGGIFLDYEMNWNRGDDMDGGLTVSGLSRSDWSVGLRQFMRLDDRTVVTAQLDSPAHRSLYGAASMNRQFDGFSLTLNANAGKSLRGPQFSNSSAGAVLEKDPVKVGNLPLRMFYGLSASTIESRTFDPVTEQTRINQQESVGFRTRLQLLPQQIDSSTNLSASVLVSQLYGKNVNEGLTTFGDVSLSKRFGEGLSVLLNYNYANDGVSSALTGHHSLGMQAVMDVGRTSIAANVNQSLDIDRQSIFLDASYQVSSLWRFSYSLTADRYLGVNFLDDFAMISYRLGVREIGVSYSIRSKRFGFQLFGTSFD